MIHEVSLDRFTPEFPFETFRGAEQRPAALTQGRRGWRAEARRHARRCTRAGLDPGGGRRGTPPPLSWRPPPLQTGKETLGLGAENKTRSDYLNDTWSNR